MTTYKKSTLCGGSASPGLPAVCPTPIRPSKGIAIYGRLGACLLFAFVSLALSAQPRQTGVVTGRIYNPATGEYMRNAEVRVQNGPYDRTVVSEADGAYRVTGVPIGLATVTVHYTGYRAETVGLQIADGETISRDFNLISTDQAVAAAPDDDLVRLDVFTVSAEREGNAKAIMEQRAALNFKNVVASDVFGDVAEGNVGEFLKFMPGINLDYVEADTRAVRIRGLDPKYAAVTMDGDRMASAGSSNLSASRQFEFEQVSINSVDTIEVNKTQTADMDADAVAGSINLKSRSAFNQKGQRILLQFNSTANSYEMNLGRTDGPLDKLTRKIRPGGMIQYSNSFFRNRLGVVLVASYSDMYNEQFRLINNFDYNPIADKVTTTGTTLGTANMDPVALYRLTYKDGPKLTERTAASLNLDYKLTPRTILSLRTSYAGYSNKVGNAQVQITVPRANQDRGSTLYHTIVRNYNVRVREADPLGVSGTNTNTNIYMDGRIFYKHGSTTTFSGEIEHKGDRLRANAIASYSHATNHYDDLAKGSFGAAAYRMNQGISFDISRNNQRNPAWMIRQLAGDDIYDLSNYRNNSAYNLNSQPKFSDDKRYSVQTNVTWTPPSDIPIMIRAGLKAREEIYNIANYNYSWQYLGPGGSQATAYPPASSFVFNPEVGGNLFSDSPMPYPDRTAFATMFKEHPEYFVQNAGDAVSETNLTAKKYVREKINAAYVRADLRFNRLLMQGGIRAESTEEIYKVYENLVGSKMRNRYDDIFLSISAKYKFTPNLMLLVGYGQGLQRPDFGNLTGVVDVNDDAMTFSMPNQNLQPEYSHNYNVMLEYYFEPVGVIRASVFMLDVKNIQYRSSSVDGEAFGLPGYTGSTTLNGPKLVTTGFELEYSQNLSFLVKGLSVFANYTRVEADADTEYDIYGYPSMDTEILAGALAPNVASGGVSYSNRWLLLRVNSVWTDETYSGFGTVTLNEVPNVQFRRYKDSRFMMDLNITFKFTRNVTLNLSGRNIFNEASTWYDNVPYTVKTPDRLRQYERYGTTWTASIKATF